MSATAAPAPAPPTGFARFWAATRPYSFTAAAVPVLIGSLAAVAAGGAAFAPLAFVLVLVGSIAVQSVANVVNDLYDRRTGLDRPDNYGRFNSIVAGVVSEAEAKRIVLVASALSLAVAAWFFLRVGSAALPVLVGGAFLAFFYTAPPLRLKHRALGDAAVAAGFGFGMLYGAFLAQLPIRPAWPALLAYGAPSLLLVVGILHGNNHRDRAADRAAGARTLANVLSERASARLLSFELLAPYAIVVGAVLARVATPIWLIAFLSLPVALRLERRGRAGDVEGMYVPEVAKLHGMFGALTAGAIGLSLLLAR